MPRQICRFNSHVELYDTLKEAFPQSLQAQVNSARCDTHTDMAQDFGTDFGATSTAPYNFNVKYKSLQECLQSQGMARQMANQPDGQDRY